MVTVTTHVIEAGCVAVEIGGARALTRTAGGQASATNEISAQTVAAAARGDHTAFATIVERYDGRLRTLAYHMLGEREATSDALQDAYVKAYIGLRRFRGEAALGTWLHRIVYTTCLNHLRSRSRAPLSCIDGSADRDDASDGVDMAERVSAAMDLCSLLRGLSAEQRAAVVLVDAHVFGYYEAATILGIPRVTVASMVVSARARLRRALTNPDAAPDREEAR